MFIQSLADDCMHLDEHRSPVSGPESPERQGASRVQNLSWVSEFSARTPEGCGEVSRLLIDFPQSAGIVNRR